MCVAFSFLTRGYLVSIGPGMEDTHSDDQDRRGLFLRSTQAVMRGGQVRCPHTVVDVGRFMEARKRAPRAVPVQGGLLV